MIVTNRKKIGFILTRAYFLVHYLWQHMFSFVIWYIFLKVQNNASVTIIKKGKRINFSCIALCVILNWSLYNPQIPGPNPKILSYPACTHVSKHTNQIVRLKYFLSHLLRFGIYAWTALGSVLFGQIGQIFFCSLLPRGSSTSLFLIKIGWLFPIETISPLHI